jgi:hypothetical protein
MAGGSMLSKCANPDCSQTFLYLRQGKLFRFDVPVLRDDGDHNAQQSSGGRYRNEYFWLCDYCSMRMTLVCDRTLGVRTIPLMQYKAAS